MIAVEEPPYCAPVVDLFARVRKGWNPPSELTVSQFADQELIVTTGPLAGTHWQTGFAPYQRGILDVFHEPGVEIVVIQGSAQFGKTACSVAIVAFHIAYDPCPILIVEPTVDPMAKDFARNRLDTVIAASPILRDAVSKKRAKDASNTTLSKTFRGGSLAIGGANSAASLASRSIRLLILDEIDRYPAELPGEGSTINIALKRTTTYRGRRRILMLSSPTMEGAPIDTWHQRGDQRKFHVPCPKCSRKFAFEWKMVRWVGNDPLSSKIHCPSCDHGMGDAERVASLSGGEWISGKPDRRERNIVSMHIWEAYSPFSSLSEIVSSFMRARDLQKAGDKSEMHTWINTTLGEPVKSDAGEGVEPHALLARREIYAAPVPAGAVVLTLGIDVQDDRLEYLVVGWGPGEESWVVDRDVIPGDTSQAGPWTMLDQVIDRTYRHSSGRVLQVSASSIDSAGHRTAMVYEYVLKNGAKRVSAIIGRDGQSPIVSSPSRKRRLPNRPPIPLYTVGVDAAKSLLMSRLKVTAAGAGYVHLPIADWCDDEFAEQLTAERLMIRYTRGVPVQVWQKIRARNEVLDNFIYAMHALKLLRPDLEALAERMTDIPEPQAPAPAKQERPGQWIHRRKGWLK